MRFGEFYGFHNWAFGAAIVRDMSNVFIFIVEFYEVQKHFGQTMGR